MWGTFVAKQDLQWWVAFKETKYQAICNLSIATLDVQKASFYASPLRCSMNSTEMPLNIFSLEFTLKYKSNISGQWYT